MGSRALLRATWPAWSFLWRVVRRARFSAWIPYLGGVRAAPAFGQWWQRPTSELATLNITATRLALGSRTGLGPAVTSRDSCHFTARDVTKIAQRSPTRVSRGTPVGIWARELEPVRPAPTNELVHRWRWHVEGRELASVHAHSSTARGDRLLVREQCGDSLMVSLMCSRRPWWRARALQFFRWAMPCSTRMRREEWALRRCSWISSYHSGAFFLNFRCGGVTTRPPVWAPRPW